jgi:hypothetical protein
VAQSSRFVHGVLRSGPTNARPRCNFVDRKVALAVVLDLAGNDTHHGPLALSVFEAHFGWHAAGAAEHAAPISRCLPIWRALRFSRRKSASKSVGQPADVGRTSRLQSRPGGPPAFDTGGEVGRLVVIHPPLGVRFRPELFVELIELIRICTSIDGGAE